MTREISPLLFFFVIIIIAIPSGLLAGSFFHSQIPREILIPIGCLALVVLPYLLPEFTDGSFILMGVYLGMILNDFLSVEFLANPSFFSVFEESVTVLIALSAIFWRARKSDMYQKLRYVFLGVSFISFLFASVTFVRLVQDYLPLYPYEEGGGVVLHFRYSIIVNVIKSLFLTGLFSLSERIARIIEEP